MAGTSAIFDPGLPSPPWLDVWLEAGREGQVFTYANPDGLRIGVGDLVRVRLRGRRHTGLVVACGREPPEGLQTSAILAIEAVHQKAAVEPSWRNLLARVATDCHTGLFRTLRSALPPGWLGQSQRSGGAMGSGTRRTPWQVVVPEAPLSPTMPATVTTRQQDLLDHLAAHGGREMEQDLLKTGGFSRSLLDAALRKGLVQRRSHPSACPSLEQGAVAASARPLNQAQAEAVQLISEAEPGTAFLLWGVTGAGKTEVYLQAAAGELERGKSVLLLAPEIGLIPQLLDRCRTRFGRSILEYHSGMGEGERVSAWRRCLEAAEQREPLLAVGTRSAIFLPLAPLGLIVLDEEHDTAYKQDSPMPCYHARDVARLRAAADGARLVLGSATPSLESWWSCHRSSASTRLLRLPERIGGRPLPEVRVVDMRAEFANGHRHLISRALMERLRERHALGEQAVVLVPRRGYRSFLGCRSCGNAVLCPHCDVTLTVHRRSDGREWLRCHWCDHREEVGTRCGTCGSTAFKPFGAGTQRVLEILERELEGLRLLRFDHDTTRGRDGHRRLLERFAAGDADVMVGTQMLAKGMDLPRVTLAAVLAADGLLHRPDLRSSEQCLQLLLQLAGRAGRGERPGEVLVQTYCPDHPVIRHLVDGRYELFLDEELRLRRGGGLVPFSRACLLRLASPSASTVATAATSLGESIRPAVEMAGWSLIGPAPAPVARVAGRSRWQVLLHGPAESELPLPAEMDLRAQLPRSVSLTIDPDPLQL